MWWWIALACQQPFGTDRHDLVGFRIAAMEVDAVEQSPTYQAYIWKDNRGWSDAPVSYSWYSLHGDLEVALSHVEKSSPESSTYQFTPAPTADGVGLIAEWNGQQQSAVIGIASEFSAHIAHIQVASTDIHPSAVDGPALDVSQRENWTEHPADGVDSNQFAAFATEGVDIQRSRWMSDAGGSFFELSANKTHWSPKKLTIDDEEVVAGSTTPDGVYTLIALGLGKEIGDTSVSMRSFTVGDLPTGVWNTYNQWIPSDIPLTPGEYFVTLVADENSPWGLRISEQVDQASASCIINTFFTDVLLTGQCMRSELDGMSVKIEIRE